MSMRMLYAHKGFAVGADDGAELGAAVGITDGSGDGAGVGEGDGAQVRWQDRCCASSARAITNMP